MAVASPTATSPPLQAEAIAEFRGRLRGSLLTPDDADYEEARKVRNGMIDRYPAMIARCSGTADVVECVNFAREQGLLLSERGGAHNVAGNASNESTTVACRPATSSKSTFSSGTSKSR